MIGEPVHREHEGRGLTITSLIMTVVFLVALVLQVRATDYRAPLYWITVVAAFGKGATLVMGFDLLSR